ncbi:Protein of unknown function (DUF3043) [Isoptericola sp. CG 20/1183]|uniref:DUF3043 domain-containing protein n=1 Tax=Isoptericola halotolerans TaxID=300560 RepID=A0ABX5E9U5_9MICO|nr:MULTISPECIES: DUF3043 domain-containing protein [Isoptericola]MCK0118336.1 DUF3043 domain-containing protein [Isoptericola sp. S6320L]PRZ03275.1 Protein of unknown function (DUF3043) [Isoptericola sp. CG 20/1183]PRZ03513.1 Protein of unknown function (DUF3043) [Isoptericola halotolerans]
MIFRKPDTADSAATGSADSPSVEDPAIVRAGKGRPTPKRREAAAKNQRPLVPNDRRAARKANKEKMREERNREYKAMQTGDERYMPVRDKGPVRRYVRDHVDARWNLGEFFLPVAFVFIFLNLLVMQSPTLGALVLLGLYAVVFITLLDAVIMWQRLKRKLRDKFGTVGADGTKTYDVPRGTMMYAVMRAFQLRRSRLPKPMHKKHGVWPS